MTRAPLWTAIFRAEIFGAAMLAVGVGPSAWGADGAASWTPSVEAGLASDYLFRGVDQTRGRGEGFVSIEADGPSVHLGAFTSNVVVPGLHAASTQAEGDLYGGWVTSIDGFDLETGAVGYLFSGAQSRPDLLELYARLGRTLGPARITASADFGVLGEHAAHDGYAELRVDYPITPKWSVFGAAGHLYEDRPGVLDAFADAASQHGLNATTWNAGVNYSVTERVSLELRWSDLDRRGMGYGSKVLGSLKARLF